jgi:hypothetical protein
MQAEPRTSIAPVLVYETLVAAYFWSAFVIDGTWWESSRWPVIGLLPFAVWLACPFLTLAGLLMVPRSIGARFAWVQIVLATILAASVWYRFTQLRWH